MPRGAASAISTRLGSHRVSSQALFQNVRSKDESSQLVGTKRAQLVLASKHPPISRYRSWVGFAGGDGDPFSVVCIRAYRVADMRDRMTVSLRENI